MSNCELVIFFARGENISLESELIPCFKKSEIAMAVTPSLLSKEVPAYVMWEMYIPFGSLIQNKPIIVEVHTIKKFCCFTKLQREPLKLPRPHLKNGRIKTSQIGVICILKLSFKMKMTTCTSKREGGSGKNRITVLKPERYIRV